MNKKKGFTLVELLVVIAILAILATVSIVGYLSFTEKAKQSNDETLIAQLNTVLQANEATDGKPKTMYDALEQIDEAGYNVEKLTPTSSKNEFLWNQETNRFEIVKVESLDSTESNSNLWLIVENEDDLNKYTTKYSLYLSTGFTETDTVDNKLTVQNGLDVGKITSIATINFSSNIGTTFTFRTNGGTITVDASNATINHYGNADLVDIKSVAMNSYHEWGIVLKLEVSAGHIEFMDNSTISSIYIKDNGCKLTINKNVNSLETISIVTADNVDNVLIDKPNQVPDVAKEEAVSTFEELEKSIKDSDKTTNYYKLMENLVFERAIEISAGKMVTIDTNEKELSVSEDFSTRFFTNYGTLIITGNGTFDTKIASANGYGTVNNFGTLYVYGGVYKNSKESNASNFYNRNGGAAYFYNVTIYGGGGCVATQANTTTEIHGGYYENGTYPAIENRGNMLITEGEFKNTSCSSCDNRWGYTVRSGESSNTAYLKINGENEDSVKVTGVQGGLAVIGGTADIYNGYYETVACETHTSGSSAFYAGYFTGESYKTATTIYGGTFKSYSKEAVLVGNGNPAPDSGEGEESTVLIYGGAFIGGDAAKTAITVNKAEYAIGAAKIYGGLYSSNPVEYVPNGYEALVEGDMFKVLSKI